MTTQKGSIAKYKDKNKSSKLSNLTLSGSITRVLTIALVLVFTLIIGVTVATINITLSEAIKTTADGSADSIASQMQTVINNVDAIASDMETYLTKYYI